MISRSAQDIWEAALGELQIQVSKPNYRTWLEKTRGLDYQDNQFVVGVPNAFVAEYLDKNQRSLIEKTLINLTHQDIEVIFRIYGKSDLPYKRKFSNQTILNFNPRYTFDSFIDGECNRLAKQAALSVVQNPGLIYNPLFIFGGSGLGKTHLLQAIGQAAATRNIHVLYASAEQFTNEFVTAVREKNTGEFHNRYRNVDMLLIDDIQFIVGKEQTEESFFHTFNELHNANHQIAMTSDRPPESLPLLEERLSSRFEWGLTVGIKSPDLNTCLSILKAKADREGTDIPQNVLEFIASRDYQNIRCLEGALNRVTAYSKLIQAPPSPELAAQALKDIANKEPNNVILTPSQIIEAVAKSFQLTPADLKSKKRDRETTLARHLAMYLIRKETKCSLAQIGQELGDRDHSTVIHACESIAASIDTSPYLNRKITDIQQSDCFKQKGGILK